MSAGKTVILDNKAWAGSGNLFFPGFTAPFTTNRRRSAVVVQAEFKNPGYFTIQFGIQAPIVAGISLAGNTICEAEILWSVAGNTIRRYISVFNGTSISGAGEGVRVRMIDNSLGNFNAPNGASYPVTVMIIPGTRPTMAGSQPPFYTPNESLTFFPGTPQTPAYSMTTPGPTNQELDIAIPENCGINSVMLLASQSAQDDPTDVMTNNSIFFQQLGTVGLTSKVLANYNYDMVGRWLPLYPGANEIRVVRNTFNLTPPSLAPNIYVTPFFGVEG